MKRVLTMGALLVGLCLALFVFTHRASAPTSTGQPATPITSSTNQTSFNKQLHRIDSPDSIWWIVSKVRPLSPIDYAPADLVVPNIPLRVAAGNSEMRLRKEAAEALEEMVNAAKLTDVYLKLTSGYRSYQLQVSVYNGYVQQYGQAGADKQSARPGTSEHQTGMAADIEPATGACRLEICLADLREGEWMAAHAHEYGFVVRYPAGKEAVTGYQFEPWHIRYVGKDLAAEMHKQNIPTLEEFFDVVPTSQPY